MFVKQMGRRPVLEEEETGLLALFPQKVRRRKDGSIILRHRKGGEPSELDFQVFRHRGVTHLRYWRKEVVRHERQTMLQLRAPVQR
ncbi:MAG: hypothetical protein QM757_28355 [Paludibaculum sp.]